MENILSSSLLLLSSPLHRNKINKQAKAIIINSSAIKSKIIASEIYHILYMLRIISSVEYLSQLAKRLRRSKVAGPKTFHLKVADVKSSRGSVRSDHSV